MGWLLLPLSFIIHQVKRVVKNPFANAEDARDTGSITGSVRSPGMATHSSILASKIPWTEESGSPWCWKDSDTMEPVCMHGHTHTHTHTQQTHTQSKCLLDYLSILNASCLSTNRQRESYTKVNIWLPRRNYISNHHW